ncbi:protein of unknown function [Streptomyces sp. KY75]|nr:protein of unknown function [Streptomyces sp. KY75]CAD5988823.1 protein of unknown function [Streptomyces sp. KY70]
MSSHGPETNWSRCDRGRAPGEGPGAGPHLPRSFLIFLASAGATTTVPVSERVFLDDLCSRRWRLPALSRSTLPEPVILKRLLAPLCVLFFGIAPFSPRQWRPSRCRAPDCRGVRSLWDSGGTRGRLDGSPRRSRLGRCLGRSLGRFGRSLSGVALGRGVGRALTLRLAGGLGLTGLGHGFGLLLVRAQNHDHVPAVLLRVGLDEAQILHVRSETLEQSEAQLRAGLLTTTEHDRDLDLVALLEEPDDVTLLGVIVVRVDLRPELHLLDDRVRLVLARLTGLHGRLVLELPVVHELAHGRTGCRRHLDQVEVILLCELQGLGKRNNPDLLAAGTDKSDLGNANPVVDAGLGADGSSSVAPRDRLADSRVTCVSQDQPSRNRKNAPDGTQAGLHNYRSTAAVNRGAHRAAPSSVRNDGDRLTGDPPSVRTVRWEIGASTCGPST